MDEDFIKWLKEMGPKPPNKKEVERMGKAITVDLQRCKERGVDIQARLKCFDTLGYLYEGIVFSTPTEVNVAVQS